MEVHGHKILPHKLGFTDCSEKFFGESENEVAEQISHAYEHGYIADIMDSHSCSNNAKYTNNGPAGAGTYCTECGALVTSDESLNCREY